MKMAHLVLKFQYAQIRPKYKRYTYFLDGRYVTSGHLLSRGDSSSGWLRTILEAVVSLFLNGRPDLKRSDDDTFVGRYDGINDKLSNCSRDQSRGNE